MKRNGRTWNNGNLDLSGVKMKRKLGSYRATIGSPRENVLVRITQFFASQRDDTHWVVTETSAHLVGAVLIKPDLAIGKLEIGLSACDEGTLLSLDFVYTAISVPGNALFDDQLENRIQMMLPAFVQALQGGSTPDEISLPGQGPVSSLPNSFRPESAGTSHEVIVRGGADECFALACPVAELDWIDSWQFHLLYSDSGHNEDNCIFIEAMTGFAVLRVAGADTYWYTTLYNPGARQFQAVLLTGDFIIGRLSLEVDAIGNGSSRLRWTLTYTGLNEGGNRIILESGFETRVANMLRFIANSAKHFMQTGDILRLPVSRKARLALSLLFSVVAKRFRKRLSAAR
ncbi:MAG: hypothetical protein H6943_08740 [Zoogloeaceae bacterium]|nr:hypothetical protein [Zoogloeaceae bacterium]